VRLIVGVNDDYYSLVVYENEIFPFTVVLCCRCCLSARLGLQVEKVGRTYWMRPRGARGSSSGGGSVGADER